jgi:hypothetical protein
MMSRVVSSRDQILREWWDRPLWPAIIIAVDSGKSAGVTIIKSVTSSGIELIRCSNIDTYSRDIEMVVREGIQEAIFNEMYAIMVLETWGRGGKLGINQWIGLGETRGPWKREFKIICKELASKYASGKKVIQVAQNTWRSKVIKETGYRTDSKFSRFNSGQWKDVAHNTALKIYSGDWIPPNDAAESACIAAYASRCVEIGKLLPRTYLKKFGL